MNRKAEILLNPSIHPQAMLALTHANTAEGNFVMRISPVAWHRDLAWKIYWMQMQSAQEVWIAERRAFNRIIEHWNRRFGTRNVFNMDISIPESLQIWSRDLESS